MNERRWMWPGSYAHADIVSHRDADPKWCKETRNSKTFLYVIGRPEGPIKVGISSKPDKRVSSIQNGCPFPVEVHHRRKFYSREEARAAEAGFHKAHADRRLKGEWFDMQSAVAIALIEASFEEYDRRRRAFIDGDEL